jgi:hypothetical protein
MVRLTTYGLIVTIVTGVIFLGQLYEMISGGTQTDKLVNYSKVQANAASDQADAAQQFSDTSEDINNRISDAVDQLQDAASNAKAGIQATQDAMRLDQRAWVGVKGMEGTPQLNQPWQPHVVFTNTGRTPAKNVRMWCTLEPEYLGTPFKFTKSALGNQRTLIVPNQEPYCQMEATPAAKMDQPTLDSLNSGKLAVAVYGLVTYDDVFGDSHWLTFCKVIHTDGKAWDDCPEGGNDTGDGKKPN